MDERFQVHVGNCLEVMPTLPACSVDSIVTDPPYGLSFMGKDWDHGVPGEHFWREALRVAKPGAYLLAFGGTRTYHRLACAVEDAGFDIRDQIMWLYGSGFPKSLDVSKAIDKAAGAEREVVGSYPGATNIGKKSDGKRGYGHDGEFTGGTDTTVHITAPATDAAKQWHGWGTALKPAHEPIVVARKPLEGTVAENVTRWGTGAINVDACRVPSGGEKCTGGARDGSSAKHTHEGWNRPWKHDPAACQRMAERKAEYEARSANLGRWPANIIHDGSDEVVEGFPANVKGGTWNRTAGARHFNNEGEPTGYQTSGSDASTGSAARFFYCAKASKADRGDDNRHPTVKPTALMRYLCKLVTQPGGVVLDPFTGSGSTGKAAVLEGFRFIGIELSDEYAEIAKARINAVASGLLPVAV